MRFAEVLLVISMIVLSLMLVGCSSEEKAGEASRMFQRSRDNNIGAIGPADAQRDTRDAESLQAGSPSVAEVEPGLSGQDQGIAIPQATGSQDMPSVGDDQEPASLEGAQLVPQHSVKNLQAETHFGNVVWRWDLPSDDGACVFNGQAGFRYIDIYIDGVQEDTVDCKSSPNQLTRNFSPGGSHTIKLVTVTVDEDGIETRNSPGISDTVVVA